MEKRLEEERNLDALIRTASPRRTLPAGLNTRIMAQVARSERRRRERRAIVQMAGYCLELSALMVLVIFVGMRNFDAWSLDLPIMPFLLVGCMGGVVLTAGGDRMNELLRNL